MKILRFFFIVTFTINFQIINGQEINYKLFSSVIQQLKLKENDINKQLYVEKILPNNKDLTLIVIAKYLKNEEERDENGFIDLDEYVVIVNNKNLQIQSKYYQSNAWSSDAVAISNITLDTSYYNLNLTGRAFGVRVNFVGRSRANPYEMTQLSLFLVDGKNLKKILNNYEVSKFSGEWDTSCAGKFNWSEILISIDKKNSTNRYRNLILKEKMKTTTNYAVKDDCEEKNIIKYRTKILKFNGKEYK